MDTKRKLEVMREVDEANRKHVEDWKRKQQARKIKGVLVNVNKGTVEPVELDKSLNGYYAALDCRCIDIVQRTIGGKVFEIICDDEGLMVSNPIPSGVAYSGEILLYGNLFVVGFNGVNDVESLTDADARYVMRHLVELRHHDGKEFKKHLALMGVGYC